MNRLLLFSFVASAFLTAALVAVFADEPGPPFRVRAVVANPASYAGKIITIAGVLKPGIEARLHNDAASFAKWDDRSYIDLRPDRRLDIQFQKYFGAVVTITGRYTNRCLDRVGEIQVVCVDRGGNGWLEIGDVTIHSYIAPAYLGRDHSNPQTRLIAIDAADDRTAEAGNLAAAMRAAVQSADARALTALFASSARREAGELLADPDSALWWRFFSPEMRVAGSDLPGRGYILFYVAVGSDGDEEFDLCICRFEDCKGRWPAFYDDTYWTNIRDPYECHEVVREAGSWKFA